MKILHVSPSFPFPPNDGGKIVIYNFYLNALKQGHHVTFLCLSKSPVAENDRIEMARDNQVEVFYDPMISSPLRLLRAFAAGKSCLIDKFYNERFYRRLKEIYQDGDFDIIHFEGLHISPYAMKLKKETDANVAVRLHNVESVIMRRFAKKTSNPLMKLFFSYEETRMHLLEKKMYSAIRNVVFITQNDLHFSGINTIPDCNPFVSPAGIDPVSPEKTSPGEASELLFVGSMDWRPNEEAVLWFVNDVFRPLQKLVPGIRLTIVGKNPSPLLRALSSNTIVITGMVPNVEPYIQRCGICIIPIRVGGGMRIKILEQMAYSKAIISTTIGAEGIDYTNEKNILIADSADGFRSAIQRLLEDTKQRELLGANAREFVNRSYNWESIVRRLLEYYSKTLAGPDNYFDVPGRDEIK